MTSLCFYKMFIKLHLLKIYQCIQKDLERHTLLAIYKSILPFVFLTTLVLYKLDTILLNQKKLTLLDWLLFVVGWRRWSYAVRTMAQCRLNAWARWADTREPHEHRGPMLIYVCCVQQVFECLETDFVGSTNIIHA